MAKEKVPDAVWRALNKNNSLNKHLEGVANRIASRADAISAAEGGTARHTVRKVVRPGGRVAYDVVTDNALEEFGVEVPEGQYGPGVPRIAALRRAIRGG